MSETKVASCTCQHAYQDAKYGKGQRVFNQGKAQQSGQTRWICTVCKRVRKD